MVTTSMAIVVDTTKRWPRILLHDDRLYSRDDILFVLGISVESISR